MIIHNSTYATVAAREDIDDRYPCVIYDPNRSDSTITPIKMTAGEARRLARKLNKFAKMVSPPRPRA